MTGMIRLATSEDAAEILAIYAPFCAESPVSFEIIPPSIGEIVHRISATTAHYPWLVFVEDDAIRGYVYASQHRDRAAYRWSVDVTAYIHADSRGQGLGKALYTSLFILLRAQGFYQAIAGITLPNPASVALHIATGFSMIGVYHNIGYKAGSWRDVSWWEKSLQPTSTSPMETRSILELLNTCSWDEAITAGMDLLQRT